MFEIARGLITKELSIALEKEEMKIEREIEKIFLSNNGGGNHEHKGSSSKGNNNNHKGNANNHKG